MIRVAVVDEPDQRAEIEASLKPVFDALFEGYDFAAHNPVSVVMQRMVDTLAGEGFVETASAEDADLVILNTCHIREKASEKVYSELGRLRVAKDEAARAGREMKIAVAGCVAQAEGAEIIHRAPTVDIVVGPQSYHHLPELLKRAKENGRAVETEFPVEDKFGFLPQPKPDAIRARGISAFVTVQERSEEHTSELQSRT